MKKEHATLSSLTSIKVVTCPKTQLKHTIGVVMVATELGSFVIMGPWCN